MPGLAWLPESFNSYCAFTAFSYQHQAQTRRPIFCRYVEFDLWGLKPFFSSLCYFCNYMIPPKSHEQTFLYFCWDYTYITCFFPHSYHVSMNCIVSWNLGWTLHQRCRHVWRSEDDKVNDCAESSFLSIERGMEGAREGWLPGPRRLTENLIIEKESNGE